MSEKNAETVDVRHYRRVARIMSALSSESRLMIIDRLSRGECCLCEVADLIGLDQSTVSRHMSKLESCGLIARERRGQHVYFRLIAPWVKGFIDARRSDGDGAEETGEQQV